MRGFRRRRIGIPRLGPVRLAPGRGFSVFLFMLLVLYLSFRLTDLVLLKPLEPIAEEEARHRAIAAINKIVLGKVSEAIDPESLIHYERDNTDRIVAYHVDTRAVNRVAALAADAVKTEMGELDGSTVEIPIGSLSGIKLLGSRGPRIPVTLVPVGTITSDIKQEFKAEGINQTRHSIVLRITATVRVVLPLVTRDVTVATDMPLLDTVTVGQVPNYYGAGLGSVSVPVR
ncbi:MAG: sporulation protein YunB [Mycobacterium leprae]